MLSSQTIYYHKGGLIFLNSILEMPSTLAVQSLSSYGLSHTDTYTQLMNVLHNIINNEGNSLPQQLMQYPGVL